MMRPDNLVRSHVPWDAVSSLSAPMGDRKWRFCTERPPSPMKPVQREAPQSQTLRAKYTFPDSGLSCRCYGEGMGIYHAIIERSGPDGVHERATVEAASLDQAKQRLEARFGARKIISLTGETESQKIR